MTLPHHHVLPVVEALARLVDPATQVGVDGGGGGLLWAHLLLIRRLLGLIRHLKKIIFNKI